MISSPPGRVTFRFRMYSNCMSSNCCFGFILQNSIRHNLSLHSKFVRVQNEGSGKSSWWTINPDAKGGKTSRRRSGSLDSAPKTERKGRGRSKKEKKEVDEAPTSPHLSVITKANRSPSPSTVSPTSSSSDSLQTIPESSDSPLPFFLNDSFGRPRTNSDLSTVSVNSLGRSGSPVVDELDNEEPICVPTITSTPNPVADELIELADSMTLEPYNNGTMKTNLSPVSALLPHDQPQNDLNMTNMNSTLPVNGFENGYENGFLPGAPAQQQQLNPEVMQTTVQQLYTGVRVSQFQGGFTRQDLATQDAPRMMQPPPYPEHNMEIQQTHANMFSGFGFGSNNQRPNQNSQPQNCNFTDPYLHQVTTPSIIIENHPLQQNLNRMANQLDFMSQKFPSDLELCDTFEGGLECDMDSIIHDELSMGDGALDFNFEQFISQSAFPNTPPVTVGELSGRLY